MGLYKCLVSSICLFVLVTIFTQQSFLTTLFVIKTVFIQIFYTSIQSEFSLTSMTNCLKGGLGEQKINFYSYYHFVTVYK